MTFKRACLLFIAPVIVIADQWSKLWILRNVQYGHGFPVIPGFFDIVHVKNTGAAFGMLANAPDSWRDPFFYLIALVAVGIILSTYRRVTPRERLVPVVLGLILGGLVGNLIDRLVIGAVTDFLSFHWKDVVLTLSIAGHPFTLPLDWPAFNIADSAITTSMILLAWHFTFTPTNK